MYIHEHDEQQPRLTRGRRKLGAEGEPVGRARGGRAAGARRARLTMIEPSMRQQILERRRDLERLASCSSSLARTVCSTCGRAGTGSSGVGVGAAAPVGWRCTS